MRVQGVGAMQRLWELQQDGRRKGGRGKAGGRGGMSSQQWHAADCLKNTMHHFEVGGAARAKICHLEERFTAFGTTWELVKAFFRHMVV